MKFNLTFFCKLDELELSIKSFFLRKKDIQYYIHEIDKIGLSKAVDNFTDIYLNNILNFSNSIICINTDEIRDIVYYIIFDNIESWIDEY